MIQRAIRLLRDAALVQIQSHRSVSGRWDSERDHRLWIELMQAARDLDELDTLLSDPPVLMAIPRPQRLRISELLHKIPR